LWIFHVGLPQAVLKHEFQFPRSHASDLNQAKQGKRNSAIVGHAYRAIQVGCFQDIDFKKIFRPDEIIADVDGRGRTELAMQCLIAIAKFVVVLNVVVYQRGFVNLDYRRSWSFSSSLDSLPHSSVVVK
jgi:hypothetical protein